VPLQFMLQPFDVLKTRVINSKEPIRATDLALRIYRNESITGLYRGGSAAVVRVALGSSAFFGTQSLILGYLRDQSPTGQVSMGGALCAGACARLFGGTLVHPLSVVKTRMEASSVRQYRGVVDGLMKVGRLEGLGGLYAGYWPTVARDVPYAALQTLFYTRAKIAISALTHKEPDHWYVQAPAGLVAASLAVTITYPFDVIRTHMQMNQTFIKFTDLALSGRLRQTVKSIIQKGGPTEFYRGFTLRIAKKCVASALAWTIFEQITQFFSGSTNL